MPLFRFHRGGLAESLRTTVVVKTFKELEERILNWDDEFPREHGKRTIRVSNYAMDWRIGWYTQMVELLFFEELEDKEPVSTWVVGFLSEPL